MQHIMLDIETLGTASNSVILSIGAVEFDKSGKLGKEFHTHIEPVSCTNAGLVIDPDTVMWWMAQNEEARNNLIESPKVGLMAALNNFNDVFDWEGKEVWANGASFDFPILKNAYKAVNIISPWQFWRERCFRTYKSTLPAGIIKACTVKAAVAHDALSDAKSQALTCAGFLKAIQG